MASFIYKLLPYLLFLLISLSGGSLCLAQSTKIPLRVGYIPLITQLPVVVAQSQSRTKYQRIDVELSQYNSISALEAAIRVGATDAALVPLPIALSMAADEVDIVILGTMSRGGSLIVSRTPGSFATLKGKVIGVPELESTENILLKDIMESESLRYGLDYKVISIPLTSALSDLKDGRIDAMFFPEPFGTIAVNEGYAAPITGQDKVLENTLTKVVVIKEAFLGIDTKEAVREWLMSLAKACVNLNRYLLSDEIEHISHLNFDEEIIKISLKNRVGGLRFGAEAPNTDEIRYFLEKIIQINILYKSIAIENLVSPALLEEIVSEVSTQ